MVVVVEEPQEEKDPDQGREATDPLSVNMGKPRWDGSTKNLVTRAQDQMSSTQLPLPLPVWAEWLRNPCVVGGSQQRGQKMARVGPVETGASRAVLDKKNKIWVLVVVLILVFVLV